MGKDPGYYYYPGDHSKDEALSATSLACRGAWWELLNKMYSAGRVSSLSHTTEEFARVCRCSPTEMSSVLDELQRTHTATVTEHNGIVTVTCRRLAREAKARELTRKRVQKHRQKNPEEPPKEDVTAPYMLSSLSSSPSGKITTTTARASSVTSASQEVVIAWNKSVPEPQRVPADGTPAIDRAYSGLALAAPPVEPGEILAAIENYRQAMGIPNSQAHPHSLGQFLRREIIDRYLPGNFNPANYDRNRFNRGEKPQETAEQIGERLRKAGQL